jgi:hypothetical protein
VQSLADSLISRRSYRKATHILQTAVRLLHTVSPQHMNHSDQQYNISHFANLTSRTISLFLTDSNDTYESLRLLELGRGILANFQLEVHSDISGLAELHPEIAQHF